MGPWGMGGFGYPMFGGGIFVLFFIMKISQGGAFGVDERLHDISGYGHYKTSETPTPIHKLLKLWLYCFMP